MKTVFIFCVLIFSILNINAIVINSSGQFQNDSEMLLSSFYQCYDGNVYLELDFGNDVDADITLWKDGNIIETSDAPGYGGTEIIDVNITSGECYIELYAYDIDENGSGDTWWQLTGTLPTDPPSVDLYVSDIEASDPVTVNTYNGTVIMVNNFYQIDVTVCNDSNIDINDCNVKLAIYEPESQSILDLNETESVDIDAYSSWTVSFDSYVFWQVYEYHNTDISRCHLIATVDYDDNFDETNENNNSLVSSNWFYFLEEANPDSYGYCVGGDMYCDNHIGGTFGEGRTGHIHTGIDIACNNLENVYSISSGRIGIEGTGNLREVNITGVDNSDAKFVYLHTAAINQLQNDYCVNSGIYISNECYSINSHVHFTDFTGGNYRKNPLRAWGLSRAGDNSAPSIEEIRLVTATNSRSNWNDPMLATSNNDINVIDVSMGNPNIEILAKAGDNLGTTLHGGTLQYTLGIYSIGYRMIASDGGVIYDEEDRFVFDTLPENEGTYIVDEFNNQIFNNPIYKRSFAVGTVTGTMYHIVTNTVDSPDGQIDLSRRSNMDYTIEVIAKDIDGNSCTESVNITIIGSTATEDVEKVNYSTTLAGNYPNPFNPSTSISYSLTKDVINPEICIYNIKGQKVKTFELKAEEGKNKVIWNGEDERSKTVSSGVYFYRLMDGDRVIETKKMLMLK